MRRYTALMAQLRAQPREGVSLHFENCTGGYFSDDPRYALKVSGRTEERATVGKNLFPLGDLENRTEWPCVGSYGLMSEEEIAAMLKPGKTYTLSFEAECTYRPEETVYRENCCYGYDTGEPLSCGELSLYCEHPGLGFALVHNEAQDWSGYFLGVPDSEKHPTVAMYANHEIQNGEKYRGVVTFTTPDSLDGYTLQVLTNQYYYSHMTGPEIWLSTVSFTNIKIEEGETATPYLPYGEEPVATETIHVEAGTVIICGNERLTVPCELRSGDVWYPTLGTVERQNGEIEHYEPYSLIAPCGAFDITQEGSGVSAWLSATLMSKSASTRNGGWSWQDIQGLVRCGLASQVFKIGDQLTCKRGGTTLVWDIIGIDHDTPSDSQYKHSLTIQLHDCIGADAFQFDAAEPTNPDSNRKSYGSNNWLESGIRQWLNSDGNAGTWWEAKTEYDVEPSYASSTAGFMQGLDAEFLATVGEVSKITARNKITDGGDSDTSTEKFFLLSMTEVYGGLNNNIAEGIAYPYYADNTVLSTAGTGEDANRIKYRNGAAQYWWLRSPGTSSSNNVRIVKPTGNVSYSYAISHYGVAPACCII